MIVSDTPRTGRALPIHRIQLNLTSRRFDVAWGPPDARRSAEPPAGALPVRPVDPPPPVDEIVHGNIIYQMPRDWRRMQVSRTEHVLYGQTEPPFGPHIMLRTGGRLRAEFRQTVEASLAEGDNITAYRELRFGSHNGIRMYRMDGAEMKTERGAIQYLYYAALNAGDRFDEIVLLTYSNYGPSAEAARRAFDMLLSTVDLVNAREARNAR
jgi:hypothetical protein